MATGDSRAILAQTVSRNRPMDLEAACGSDGGRQMSSQKPMHLLRTAGATIRGGGSALSVLDGEGGSLGRARRQENGPWGRDDAINAMDREAACGPDGRAAQVIAKAHAPVMDRRSDDQRLAPRIVGPPQGRR